MRSLQNSIGLLGWDYSLMKKEKRNNNYYMNLTSLKKSIDTVFKNPKRRTMIDLHFGQKCKDCGLNYEYLDLLMVS